MTDDHSAAGEPAIPDADLPAWSEDAITCADALVASILAQAECMRGSVDEIQAADSVRERCLAELGECLSALKSRPDWRDHVDVDLVADVEASLRQVREATDVLERAALAERAAHEVMISHARAVLMVEGEMTVYARTGISRRAPDGPISLSLNGRH